MKLILNQQYDKPIYIENFSRNFIFNELRHPIHFIVSVNNELEQSINNLLFFANSVITNITIEEKDEIIYNFVLQNGKIHSIEDKISDNSMSRMIVASMQVENMTVGEI